MILAGAGRAKNTNGVTIQTKFGVILNRTQGNTEALNLANTETQNISFISVSPEILCLCVANKSIRSKCEPYNRF